MMLIHSDAKHRQLQKVPYAKRILEEVEEEIDRCVFHRNAFGVANHSIVGIPDRTITTDSAQEGLVAISDSPVVVDITQNRIVSIAHGVAINLCQ